MAKFAATQGPLFAPGAPPAYFLRVEVFNTYTGVVKLNGRG